MDENLHLALCIQDFLSKRDVHNAQLDQYITDKVIDKIREDD